MEKEVNNEKTQPTVDSVLANQVRKILEREGISDLNIENDGSLSGTYTEKLWPSSTQINNLRIEVDDKTNAIVIRGEPGETRENTGSII